MASEWTIDTLKEHLEALRKDDQQAMAAALASADRAVAKADLAMEKRFDGVNEFRAALSDQSTAQAKAQADFMPRKEFENQHSALTTAIADLSKRVERAEGKGAGVSGLAQVGFQAIVGLAAVTAIIMAAVSLGHGSGETRPPIVVQPATANP